MGIVIFLLFIGTSVHAEYWTEPTPDMSTSEQTETESAWSPRSDVLQRYFDSDSDYGTEAPEIETPPVLRRDEELLRRSNLYENLN